MYVNREAIPGLLDIVGDDVEMNIGNGHKKKGMERA